MLAVDCWHPCSIATLAFGSPCSLCLLGPPPHPCLARSLCFRCLGQLLVSYLVRAGRTGPPTPGQTAWLDRVVKPALVTARKGGLVSAQEQLDFVAELADLSPDYAVGSVIMEMLQVRWLGGAG
jgi:hypothetical protein